MSQSEQRQEVLRLLSEGKVSVAEAADLLNALSTKEKAANGTLPEAAQPAEPADEAMPEGKKASWFHVRVSDLHSNKNKVTVNIPVRLVKLGLGLGRRFTPNVDGVDWHQVDAVLADAHSGVLVDVEDEEGGERVQIYLD